MNNNLALFATLEKKVNLTLRGKFSHALVGIRFSSMVPTKLSHSSYNFLIINISIKIFSFVASFLRSLSRIYS